MIRPRGGSLEVRVYTGGGRKARRVVTRTVPGTDKDAWRRARQIELDLTAEVAEGRVSDGAGATFGQLIDRWLLYARIEESTRYMVGLQLKKHVVPVLGSVKLARLRPEDLDDLYHALERRKRKKLAPTTVRRLHATIRSVLALGVKLGWIARNPADGATPPPEGSHEPVAPSTEAVVAFLAAVGEDEPELAMFVRLDAVTGMRRAEVCALRRSDLDLDAGAVRKSRALGTAKGAPYVKGTKSGARHALALDAETVHQLRLHLKAQDALAAEHDTTVGPDGYVFSLEVDGSRPMRPDYVSKRVRTRRDAIPGAGAVTLRGLRHWMATEGLDSGASVKAVSGRAGHARTSTTTDRYAAWIPASDVTLARHLGDALD